MTEQEWLECTEPQKMVEFLRGKASERKLRLLACACFRAMCHLLPYQDLVDVITVEELYADGAIGKDDASEARIKASTAMYQVPYKKPNSKTARITAENIVYLASDHWQLAVYQAAALAGNSCVIYEIFGNPFRSVSVDMSWLAWHSGTVSKIAQAIYDDRALDGMPILADALEDAGCTNADILNHCRQSREHVRGCWVVDLILGKQ
jgi:hypothetical protein